MGSCISKCKSKKSPKKEKPKELISQCIDKLDPIPIIQDKLIISQATISSPPTSKNSPIDQPLSPSTSISSPSFSNSNSNYPTTSSSSSSCSSLSSASSTSSSILSSKSDRLYSNEFLWSCAKENPQMLRPEYPFKITIPRTRTPLATRSQNNSNKLIGPKQQLLPSPQRVARQVAQKRSRCSSPTPSNVTRQKSFRRENDLPISTIINSGKDMRPISPSPSRRFKGDVVTSSSSIRRDNGHARARSPSNLGSRRYGRSNNLLAKRESNDTNIKRIESKIEEHGGLGKLISGQDMDWMPIEDVNNPHIALDCFIFL